jgi:prevent-host-death family protein
VEGNEMSEIIVGVYDAKTRLAGLITQVEKGESVTITRHGKAVARLVPVEVKQEMTVSEALEAIDEFRKGHSLNGLSIREMIDEGRR